MATTSSTKRAPWDEKPYGLDDPCDATPEEARRGVVHLAIVAAVFVVIALATYLVPLDAMRALRPWEQGEEVQIARLYGRDVDEVSGTAIATGGASAGTSQQGPLDDSVLANLEE